LKSESGARWRSGFRPEQPQATWSRPNQGFFAESFSTFVDVLQSQVDQKHAYDGSVSVVAGGEKIDLRLPQVGKKGKIDISP